MNRKTNDRSKDLVGTAHLREQRIEDRAHYKREHGYPMKCPRCGNLSIMRTTVQTRLMWRCGVGHTWSTRDANSGARR